MRSNCTGREFFEYARDTLANENYRAAVYLSCVAEFEFSNSGDFDGLIEAMQFTGVARAHFISELETEAYKRGINPTPEFMGKLMKSYCEYILRPEFFKLMEDFTEDKPPEDLVNLIETSLMEIPKIKWK
ncbi:MAG: hypothetical protein Q8R00_00105 [Candidatus Nanoarchaeia archaeon]|nr:hypothetical protein [Candidatus Nanoarchaeia archaeon]